MDTIRGHKFPLQATLFDPEAERGFLGSIMNTIV